MNFYSKKSSKNNDKNQQKETFEILPIKNIKVKLQQTITQTSMDDR